jgi:predicted DNA-binding transcriptional regulator AlpA
VGDVEALLPLLEVRARVGLSTSAIYERMDAGTFPRPCKEGTRSLWVASEVAAWIQARIDARNMGKVVGRNPRRTKKPLVSAA